MATAAIQSAAIEFTFEKEGHIYRDMLGQQILSVTQVLDSAGIVNYSGAPEEALAFKSEIGDAVHKATEIIDTPDKGELDWDEVDPRCMGYVLSYERFKDETGFVASHVEFSGAVRLPQGNFAFTVDRLGTFQGLPVVFEIKCTLKQENSWRCQLAGYVDCIKALGFKPEGAPTWKRIAVQLKPDGTYRLYPYDDRTDFEVWRWAAALATWKKNSGYRL
jgi:hypothetical protein